MNWKQHSTVIVLCTIIVLMGAEIIYLVYQNRQLTAMLNDPSQLLERTLKSGQTVPAIRAADINGEEITLTYSESSPYTLVYWFSPTCESCEENFGFWNDIYSVRVEDRLRVVGFCACNAGEGRETKSAHALQYPVLAATEQSIVDMYKGNLLPQTLLIKPDGEIVQVWPGALPEMHRRDIMKILTDLETIRPKEVSEK